MFCNSVNGKSQMKKQNRREFLKSSAVGASILFMGGCLESARRNSGKRPNILWITCEDISANLGCYGDSYAKTPNLDRLARESVLYMNMYATASVCSPARSCIITGVHAGSLGTQHLRAKMPKPEKIRCFPEYLRDAGYYCTNNVKEDYQFKTPKGTWDESSNKAHWRNRPEGKPFFSIFNLTMTHQRKTRYDAEQLQRVNDSLPEKLRHDPAKAPLPPYYPDTEVIRNNVAAYYTQITLMDKKAGAILNELDSDGLADDTIVFFFSDHGGGIPRGKRWLHHNGIHVPFMVRCPEKYRYLAGGKGGSRTDRLVSFVDLAPTMLSLVGLDRLDYLQGKAFLGQRPEMRRDFIFASRDRIDEVILCNRTVIDGRYQYIRNFHPHRPRMPLSWYSEKTPIRAELRRLHFEGKLKGNEAWLVQETIPAEELYDIKTDPHLMNNLAESSKYKNIIIRLRKKLFDHMLDIKDTGIFSESQMHNRFTTSPYEGMSSVSVTEYKAILNTARLVGMGTEHGEFFIKGLSHADSAIRYWSAVGLVAMGKDAESAKTELQKALIDQSASVRVNAAEALCKIAPENEIDKALAVLVKELKSGTDFFIGIEAATALFAIGEKAKPVLGEIQEAKEGKHEYVQQAIDHVMEKEK